MKNRKPCILVGISILFLLLVSLIPTQASKADYPYGPSLTNSYVRTQLGEGGTVDFVITFADATTESHTWPVSGRWAVININGDPETSDDDWVDLVKRWKDSELDTEGVEQNSGITAPSGKLGFWKVKIGETCYIVGDASTGSWTVTPETIFPPAGLGYGKTGNYIRAEWTISGTNVSIYFTISLVRDQTRFDMTIKNRGASAQKIGLAMVGTVGFDPKDFSEYAALPYIKGIGAIRYGKLLSGRNIPSVIEIYDDIANPSIVLRTSFGVQDCTPPDYYAVGDMFDLAGWYRTDAFTESELSFWLEPATGKPNGDYNPDPLRTIGRWEPWLISWTACWKQTALAKNATRKLITYVGVGAADASWTYKKSTKYVQDSVALAVQSPRALGYDSTDPLRTSDLSPDQFAVNAYINNLATDPGPYELPNVVATIVLPVGSGLELVAGEKASKIVGKVAINSESSPVTWNVTATGETVGEREYYVTAKDTVTGWSQSVKRKILVPATSKSVSKSGWQLFSAPFTFDNTNIYSALQKSAGQIFANRWMPSGGSAGEYSPVTDMVPGEGFWMYVPESFAGLFTVADDRHIVGAPNGAQTDSIWITVKPGWNMVGNPFLYPIYLSQISVYNKTENLAVPMGQAITNGWINSTLYDWNSDKGSYSFLRDLDAVLMPWKGYWVRSKYELVLIFTPVQYPSSSIAASSGG